MLNPRDYDKVARAMGQKEQDEETIVRNLGFMINKARYETMYPFLPSLPMCLALIGMFGAGKSSKIITLVSIMRRFNLFNKTFYFSDTGLLDEKMGTFLSVDNQDFSYNALNLGAQIGEAYRDRGETPPWEKPKEKTGKAAAVLAGAKGTPKLQNMPNANTKNNLPKLVQLAGLNFHRALMKPMSLKKFNAPTINPQDTPKQRLAKMRWFITPWKLYIFDDATEMPFIKLNSPFLPFWSSMRHLKSCIIMGYHSWKQPSPLLRKLLTAILFFNAGNQAELHKMAEECNTNAEIFTGLMEALRTVDFASLLMHKNRKDGKGKFVYNLSVDLPWKDVKAIAEGDEPMPNSSDVDITPFPDPLLNPEWRLKDITPRESVLWDRTIAMIRETEAYQAFVEPDLMQIAKSSGAFSRKRQRPVSPTKTTEQSHSRPPNDQPPQFSVTHDIATMAPAHKKRTSSSTVTTNASIHALATFRAAQNRLRQSNQNLVGANLTQAIRTAQSLGDQSAAASLIRRLKFVSSRRAPLAYIDSVGAAVGLNANIQRLNSLTAPPRKRFLRSNSSIGRGGPGISPDLRSLIALLQGRAIAERNPQLEKPTISTMQVEILKQKLINEVELKKLSHANEIDLLKEKSILKTRERADIAEEKARAEGYKSLTGQLNAPNMDETDNVLTTTPRGANIEMSGPSTPRSIPQLQEQPDIIMSDVQTPRRNIPNWALFETAQNTPAIPQEFAEYGVQTDLLPNPILPTIGTQTEPNFPHPAGQAPISENPQEIISRLDAESQTPTKTFKSTESQAVAPTSDFGTQENLNLDLKRPISELSNIPDNPRVTRRRPNPERPRRNIAEIEPVPENPTLIKRNRVRQTRESILEATQDEL